MYMPRTAWNDLAAAIILRAVEDYRHTNNRLRVKPEDTRLQTRKAEIEEFFHSSWFQVLTDLNGKQLLHQLQAEMKQREDVE